MTQHAPHLLLRSPGPCRAAQLLSSGGYVVSKVEDALALRLAGAPHIDGTVIHLPVLDTIRLGRALETRYGAASLVIVAITASADAVRRALPFARVLTPPDVEHDLVSAVDLAIAGRQMRMTG
jgi:CheY-like chemotaxis protein